MVSNTKIEFCVCWIAAVNLLHARTVKYSVNFFFSIYKTSLCTFHPFPEYENLQVNFYCLLTWSILTGKWGKKLLL